MTELYPARLAAIACLHVFPTCAILDHLRQEIEHSPTVLNSVQASPNGDDVICRFFGPAAQDYLYLTKASDLFSGGNRRTALVLARNLYRQAYRWTPDGRSVILVLSDTKNPNIHQVCLIDVESKRIQTVCRGAAAALAPDGQHYAIARSGMLVSRRVRDGKERILLRVPGASFSDLSWSLDSIHVVAAISKFPWTIRESSRIAVVSVGSGDVIYRSSPGRTYADESPVFVSNNDLLFVRRKRLLQPKGERVYSWPGRWKPLAMTSIWSIRGLNKARQLIPAGSASHNEYEMLSASAKMDRVYCLVDQHFAVMKLPQ